LAGVRIAQDARMNVEECLREIRGKAALVRYLASSATLNPEMLDPEVLAGLWTVCEEIESLTASVSRTLSVDTLAVEVKAERRK
jgi:hypothetical protein